ncbi:transposase [Kitasatospora herbaricolor]|uniref:Transposase n=1 Tax=Kitasatospora herbaricolor TaxID=68217 RepID=A0ABZ1W9M8_9ACTN|nr:transposase [Kitasatospora herbaricolor]
MSTGLAPGSLPLLAGDLDGAVGTLCSAVLASMQRSDQRTKGERYVRGLLMTEGRKSMRNIALHLGADAAGQSMHHFISCSTWDWRPVREALARHLETVLGPQAWVLRPMTVPKAGEHTVGVERRVDPGSGRVVNSQRAYGLWSVSARGSSPVNWGLHLPAGWLADRARRSRAKIPERWGESSPGECAGRAVVEAARGWGLPRRPVVLDLDGPESAAAVAACQAAGIPFLARIDDSVLLPAGPAGSAGRREARAQQLLTAASSGTARVPVQWWDPVLGRARSSLAVTVRLAERAERAGQRPGGAPAGRPGTAVASRPLPLRPGGGEPGPAGRTGGRGALTLLGEWSDGLPWPTEYWLTDLNGPPAALLRLAKLARRVERDFEDVGEPAGLREFEGRSFEGWHRHTTLASVAHAARILTAGGAPALVRSA